MEQMTRVFCQIDELGGKDLNKTTKNSGPLPVIILFTDSPSSTLFLLFPAKHMDTPCVLSRETREGWPLLTVEIEVNGDSKNTNERGPSFDGSLGFCSVLGCSSRPSTKYFFPRHKLSPSKLGRQPCWVACLCSCPLPCQRLGRTAAKVTDDKI